MRRRRILAIIVPALLALTLVCFLLYLAGTDRTTLADFEHVRIGMTIDEVHRLLGPPESQYTSVRKGTTHLVYLSAPPRHSCNVETKDGVVLSVTTRPIE